ncbi:hypothetical protein [Parvularcula sp. LCG005]|uniref:hypothetical protein n=1 Tax=Parvularcula sp. LCG005 TaxID=3078805 RepID=UPI002942B081|nr:hypothetical protein [Parvularcula sp. LCG005]WOI54326.1 hypothetical protein RUI03_04820 [Parvularcula sp. LCG005]
MSKRTKTDRGNHLHWRIVGQGDRAQTIGRWIPSPGLRDKGFKSIDLWGPPGPALLLADWQARGFAVPPDTTVCHKGLARTAQALPIAAARRVATELTALAKTPAQAVVTVAHRPPARPRRRDINALLDEFLANRAKGKASKGPVSNKTLQDYNTHLNAVRSACGDELPLAITKQLLEMMYEHWFAARGQTAAYKSVCTFKSALAWAYEREGWEGRVPPPDALSKIDISKPAGRIRIALPAEIDALMWAMEDPGGLYDHLGTPTGERILTPKFSMGDALTLMLWTCARVNDALSLTDQAINANDGFIRYTQAKTKKRIVIPILGPLTDRIPVMQRARRARQGDRHDELVINEHDGRPYWRIEGKDQVRKHKPFNEEWNARRALAGQLVPSLIGEGIDPLGDPWTAFNAQDCRDTAVTRLFAAGCSVPEVASWHGSNDLSLLVAHYLKIMPTDAVEAGEKLSTLAEREGWKV